MDWERTYVEAADKSPEQAQAVEYAYMMHQRAVSSGENFSQRFMARSNLALFLAFFPEADLKF